MPADDRLEDGMCGYRRIIDHRTKGGMLEYLVQRAGTDPKTKDKYEPKWVPEDDVTIDEYLEWVKERSILNGFC